MISYTGIEPLLIDTDATANYQFNLPATADTVEFKSAGGSNLILDSINGTFEDTTFDFTGASSIVVNLGAGNDSLTQFSLDGYAGSVTINGDADDDTLTANFASGQAIPTAGATFNGGTQVTGDLVRVLGSGTETATYTPHSTTNGSGAVVVNSRTLSFTGLEPLDIVGMATANVLFPNGDDVLGIANGTDIRRRRAPAIVVSGTSGGVGFETVALRNNTNVNIDTTTVAGAPDLVTINSADNAHGNTNLTITTGAGLGDMIDISGGVTVTGRSASPASRSISTAPTSIITATTVTLNAGTGSITDGTAGANIAATTLTASATTGITLDTNVTNLSATTTGAGAAISLNETNSVTLVNVTTNAGPINVTAGGTVTADNVNAGTSNVTIAVTGGSLISGAADGNLADIVGDTLNLSVTGAGNDIGTSAAARLEFDAVTLNASTGGAAGNDMFLDDRLGNLALGLVDAGAGNVNLNVQAGNLTSAAGDAGVADLVGNVVTLNLATTNRNVGAGAANRLELNAVQLMLTINGAGPGVNNAHIVDTAGGLQMNNSTVGNNAATFNILVQNGNLTSVNDNTRDVGATNVILEVTGAGTIGNDAVNSLEINATTTFTATSAGGNIFVEDRDADFPVALVNANGGNVDLRSVAAMLDANGADQQRLRCAACPPCGERNWQRRLHRDGSQHAGRGKHCHQRHPCREQRRRSADDRHGQRPGRHRQHSAGAAGLVTITNASPVTVAANMSAVGAITVTASESAAADNLIVNAGVSITSSGSSITLNAGDDATINAGVLLDPATTLTINIDSGNADAAGATLTIDSTADIDAASATFNGNTNNDTFTIAPDDGRRIERRSRSTASDPQTFPGDVLNLDISGLTSPTLTVDCSQ